MTGIVAGIYAALFVAGLVLTLCTVRALKRESAEWKRGYRAGSSRPEKVLRIEQSGGTVTLECRAVSDERSAAPERAGRAEK